MKAKIRGAELAYDVRGGGPALLLLHAFPLGLAQWDDQARALSGAFQVVRFDARGFGGSPPGDGLLTMERVADDAAALLDHLQIAAATVCGLSMGGYAALAFARNHPTRLRGLVLADTKASADSDQARRVRGEQADKVRKEGTAAIVDAVLPKLLGKTSHEQRPQVVARVRDLILANPRAAVTDAGRHGRARGLDAHPARDPRAHPGRLRRGRRHHAAREAEALHAGIKDSTLELIPKAGHLANLEARRRSTARWSFPARVG